MLYVSEDSTLSFCFCYKLGVIVVPIIVIQLVHLSVTVVMSYLQCLCTGFLFFLFCDSGPVHGDNDHNQKGLLSLLSSLKSLRGEGSKAITKDATLVIHIL